MVFSRFLLVFLIFSLGAAPIMASKVLGQTPLPRLKPQAPQAAPQAPQPDAGEQAAALQDAHNTCLRKLKAAGVSFSQTPTVAGQQTGCGIPYPVKIIAVRNGSSVIQLPGAPVLTCQFALRFSRWAANAAAPILSGDKDVSLRAIATGPGYQCRRRNRSKSGKISEHARGNAIDISGFELTNGTRIGVAKRATGNLNEKRLLTTLGLTACGYFSTVLGPGSNAAHNTHFHFDHQKRGKNWNYRLCE